MGDLVVGEKKKKRREERAKNLSRVAKRFGVGLSPVGKRDQAYLDSLPTKFSPSPA